MKKLILFLVLALTVGLYAETTNISVAFHTEDLALMPRGLTPDQAVQAAADTAVKNKQRLFISQAFEKATEDQRRALVAYIKQNMPPN